METSLTNTSQKLDLATVEKEIRPFPATATKIMSLCNSQDSATREIAELIECEPAIAVKLLAMANSPIFATSRAITSINQAIVMLGYRSVSQMALTVAAGPLFTSGDQALMNHRVALFRQSLGVATVSRLLSERLNISDPSEAFLGGMMLDVGKLFFFDVAPTPYLEILNDSHCGNTATTELKRFGLDHPTVGNHCARKWGLPTQISNLIQNHHIGDHDSDDELLRAVVAGIYFAEKWQLGFEKINDTVNQPEIESLVNHCDENELRESATEQYRAIESIFFS